MGAAAPTPKGKGQVHAKSICVIHFQERECYWGDLMESTLNVGGCLDANRLISFKFGVMIDTTRHYSLISYQGHRYMRKLQFL